MKKLGKVKQITTEQMRNEALMEGWRDGDLPEIKPYRECRFMNLTDIVMMIVVGLLCLYYAFMYYFYSKEGIW